MTQRAQFNQVLQLGHPLLKQQAMPVSIPISPEIRELTHDLMQEMAHGNGVGIAAPQIGRSQQVMIIASRPNLRYPNAPKMDPLPMINPKIISYSSDKSLGWEGCLSVPGLRGQVERAQSIQIQYYDLDNTLHQQTFQGFVARIIQHEYDHLLGKVFLDRIQSSEQLMTEQEYFRQII